MKKSFMTRALATGLSLAMAFSLTAATNVTSASAAAKKPTLVTYAGASAKSLEVKVDETVKVKVNAATKKNYKISAVKVSGGKSAKIAAKKNKAGTVVAITGKTATPEGKQASVKVSFKAKKTGKTSKYSYVSKVSVIEDKLTMTAEAKGVKKIAVNFNKAVDTTKAVITVKKGAATITATTTFAADAKSAELALGSKLTAGTYTVTVTGLDEALSADIVTKDETLTSFELVGKNLVASAKTTTVASISFKALNQYGEMMAPNSLNVSSTFATAANTTTVAPSATKAGKITCSDIATTLAIPGTVGTLVIVDTQTGVNLNEQITYQPKATPSTVEVAGIYSEKTEKLIEGNLKKGDTVGNYKLMVNIKDQYGTEMTAADAKDAITLNPAPVLTDLTTAASLSNSDKDITYDGKNYVLIGLSAGGASKIQKAGTLNLTIVGSSKGVLATPSIVVDEPTVISSISVAPATALYAGQKNDLVVEATDVNGKAVTSYDDLKAANIKINSTLGGTVTLNKNSDGTGKFVYDATSVTVPNKDEKHRNSTLGTLTVFANESTSTNYLVKSVNITVYEKTTLWEVTGTTAKTITAAASGTALSVDLSTLNYADQYGNSVAFKDADNTKISYLIVDKAHVFTAQTGTTVGTATTVSTLSDKKNIKLTAGSNKGTADLYLRVMNAQNKDAVVTEEAYDLKLTLSVVDGKAISVSDVEIASINDGKEVYAEYPVTFVKSASASAVGTGSAIKVPVVVTATVNGKKVVLDPKQYTITNPSLGGYGENTATNDKRETKTLNVVVEAEDGPIAVSKEYTASNKGAAVAEIKAQDSTDVKGAATLTAKDLKSSIKLVSQYGDDLTDSKYAEVLYTVTFTGDNDSDATVSYNTTQMISIALKNATSKDHTADITYKYGNLALTLTSVKIAK